MLMEINGRLEYTGQNSLENFGYAERPWILNTGSYTQDWEARFLKEHCPQREITV
jgi:hypothetical protein